MNGLMKQIPGYEGLYDITNNGSVLNLKTFEWMRPSVSAKGYHVIGLTKDGERKYFRLCRLVASVFLPNPNNYPVVNHKDEVKHHDAVYINDDGTVNEERSNLEWCTVEYNTNYGTHQQRRLHKYFLEVQGYTQTHTDMREPVNVSFYCRQQKVKDGRAPVEVCINVKGQRTVFQLPETFPPAEFREKRNSKRTNEVKELCNRVQARFTEIYKRFPGLTGKDYKRMYTEGMPLEKKENLTVASLAKEYLDNIAKKRPSYYKYRMMFERFCTDYGDRLADSIIPGDITTFIDGLKRAGYADGTRRNYYSHIKSLFSYAFDKRYIRQHPFNGVKYTFRDPNPVYLTPAELDAIRALDLEPHLERVRDLFLFMCGSGLEFSDVYALCYDSVREKDGLYFIEAPRQKTSVPFTAILINDALDIWRKYEGLLPMISNQKTNKALKDIALRAGIQDSMGYGKKVSTLTARHSYATALLSGVYTLPENNGQTKPITIDVLRRCLGHTHTSQSEVYASLLDESLFNAFRP